jgi:hypothetical protein
VAPPTRSPLRSGRWRHRVLLRHEPELRADTRWRLGHANPFGGDYRLRFESPLRNAGTDGYTLGPLDLDGRNRLNEAQFDIGAYENREVMLRDGFEDLP